MPLPCSFRHVAQTYPHMSIRLWAAEAEPCLKQESVVQSRWCGCCPQVPRRWMKYLLPKGFVAVDGCSLTVRFHQCL